MPQIIQQAQPRLEPIPTNLNFGVVKLAHLALPLLLRVQFFPWLPAGITNIQVANGKTLAEYYQKFQQGQIRLILAFRHIEVDDPLCGLHLLSRNLPAIARQHQIPLKTPLHAHFLYDRGMPIWGGKALGWVLSRFGGISIRRGKRPDWQALRAARDLVSNGALPFAIAPEGATNGHSELVGPLEPGVAQLAFWCIDDIQKAKRSETVWLIPMGIQYSYKEQPWGNLDKLMSDLELSIGLPNRTIDIQTSEFAVKQFYERLLLIGETISTKLEQFYQTFYPNQNLKPLDQSLPLGERIQALLDRSLAVAEAYFGVKSSGTPVDRCRVLEEAAWQWTYCLDTAKPLSSLDQGLADWTAQESSLRIIHMRLAESFVAVSGSYVASRPSFERFAETTLLLFDALARIRGDKLPKRPRLGIRQAKFTVGEPISISNRYTDYKTNRQAAKKAIQDLTDTIRQSLEKSID